ncbi:bola-like protein [Serendipita vermifera]|nr:bola-like protein [Serendipita vermifera]
MTEGERHIFDLLNDKLDPKTLVVQDVSGGCGEFYALQISSKAFNGLTMIKQHRLVQELLKVEIKGFHGIQLKTSAEE